MDDAKLTAKIQNEDRIKEVERRLRLYDAALANTPDLVYVFDLNHRFIYVNDGLLRMWGRTWDEAIGKNCLELGYEPWHAAMHDREIEQVVATKQPVKGEVPFTGTFGRRNYEYIFVPVLDEKGEVEAVAGTTRDVTERKKSEEALRETNATLRSFYETAPVMMGVVEVHNDDVLHLTDNAATCRFFGVDRDALAGKNASELGVRREYLQVWVRHYRETERTGKPIRFEYLHETAEGSRWISAIVYCIERLSEGRCRCSYVAEDVTERKQAVEELRQSEERFARFMQHLPGLAWVKDREGRYVFANDAALNAFGRSRNDVYGKTDKDLFSAETAAQFQQNDQQALADGSGVRVIETLEHDDGIHHSIVSKFPIPGRDGRPAVVGGVAIDITELKRAEEALKDADRRKDEFLATLAHELRNPLAPIRNSLQILKMPRVDAQTIERSREMMERQLHHLVRLVDDLLDVSRVMRGKIELRKERIELATIVARAVETVQPMIAAQRHHLKIEIPAESLLIEADSVRMTQVIANLLTNAAKYSEPEGQILLSVERTERSVELIVRDTGIGIASDMLARIFELFVQVDHASTKSQGGLGIGLTLVKNLVEMHQGTIEARSNGLGKGSEFVLTLPLTEQAGEQDRDTRDEEPATGQSPESGFRLLVVDDNEDAANSLAMLLRLHGHEVRVAFSGEEALEITNSFIPDAVFQDIGMPDMDGFEIVRRLRMQPGLETTVMAALTGWGQKEDRRRTAEAGFHHHLVKPPELKMVEEVLATLRRR